MHIYMLKRKTAVALKNQISFYMFHFLLHGSLIFCCQLWYPQYWAPMATLSLISPCKDADRESGSYQLGRPVWLRHRFCIYYEDFRFFGNILSSIWAPGNTEPRRNFTLFGTGSNQKSQIRSFNDHIWRRSAALYSGAEGGCGLPMLLSVLFWWWPLPETGGPS